MAIQNCIASKSVLVSRGILNNNIDLCPLCNLERETPNHLLILCQYDWQTWTAIIQWWKLVWVSPPSLMALFQFWNHNKFKNLEKLCWMASFYAVIWAVWLCRNDSVFNKKVWEVEEIIALAKTRMAIWIKGVWMASEKWRSNPISFPLVSFLLGWGELVWIGLGWAESVVCFVRGGVSVLHWGL